MGMRELTPTTLWEPYLGHEGGIVAFLRLMIRHDLSPVDALAAHDQYVAGLRATMVSAPDPEPTPDTRRPEGQADTEYRLGACPRCGGEVWAIKKCPHISPPWRTFLACDNETCGYHGRSRLTVDVLRRQWPDGVEED